MAISKRTLEKWRGESLKTFDAKMYDNIAANLARAFVLREHRILCLTQELIDFHLLEKEKESDQTNQGEEPETR